MSTPLGTDIDIRPDYLEEHWDENVRCQINHMLRAGESFTCTVEVVARKTTLCRGLDLLICRSSYERNVRTMSRGAPCDGCGKSSAECWTVTPV